MRCKIADFNIEIINEQPRWEKKLIKYKEDFLQANIIIDFNDFDLEYEKTLCEPPYVLGFLKNAICLRKIGNWLPINNAFILHSACFDVDGVGIAFAAHSGTGKTTHMLNWQKVLGDKMTVVNGDKPIIRFFDDEPNIPYAYGTPWNGKEHFGCNMRTQLKHICFIERSQTNFVEKVEKAEVIDKIFNQVYMPKDPVAVMKTMELIDKLLSCCELWKIHCNMDISSAQTAINAILNV